MLTQMVDEFQLVIWSCSSVGLERRPVTAEVAGSSPVRVATAG